MIHLAEGQVIPRPFYLVAVLCGGLGSFVLYRAVHATPVLLTSQVILLLLAAVASENFALSLPEFNVSLAFPLIVAAIVLAGPATGAVVAGVCFTNLSEIRERRPWPPLMFNLGQLVLSATVGGWTYAILGGALLWREGQYHPITASELPVTVITAVTAALTMYAVNIGLTSLAVSMLRGHQARVVANAMLAYLPTQLALACVGVLIAQVLAVSALAFPLFLFPLVLARQVYQSYEKMRGAYLDTVRSLVKALEAKDPYTRGHSERVASYARCLAEQLGMDERAIEKIERSALLHDIGKLALSEAILTKAGPLDAAEFEAMKSHPVMGAELIARIPPLRVLEANIRAHHEWVDGSGYPRGLHACDIPLAARILSVADAYDAMTTARAYRPAMDHERAVEELMAGADSQFDSGVVNIFVECGLVRSAGQITNDLLSPDAPQGVL